MKRRLVNTLAVLSLLLCLAVVVMWVRSYVTYDKVNWGSSVPSPPYVMREAIFKSARGTFDATLWYHGYPGMDEHSHERWAAFAATVSHEPGWRYTRSTWYTEPPSYGTWFGVHHYDESVHSHSRVQRIVLPYWLLTTLMVTLPTLLAFRRWRAAVRDRVGRCAGCGYDLRASPERCPECGRAVE